MTVDSKSSQEALCRRLEDYWRQRGVKMRAWTVETLVTFPGHWNGSKYVSPRNRHIYEIKSTLHVNRPQELENHACKS